MSRQRRRAARLLAPMLVLASAPAWACPPVAADGAMVAGAKTSVAWRTEDGGSPSTGRPLTLVVTLCPADANLRRVDATMPEHRHGMNYRPTLGSLGGGRWRVEGMLLHMAGRWELRFDIESASGAESLRTSVVLK